MAGFHLTATDNTVSYAIQQGASYDRFAILYEADVSLWTPQGQIRKNYLYKEPNVPALADFSFDPLVYGLVTVDGVEKLYTTIHPLLTASQTRALPIPSMSRKGGDAKPGSNCWVYDIKLIHPTNPEIVIICEYGYVEIDPDVTLIQAVTP